MRDEQRHLRLPVNIRWIFAGLWVNILTETHAGETLQQGHFIEEGFSGTLNDVVSALGGHVVGAILSPCRETGDPRAPQGAQWVLVPYSTSPLTGASADEGGIFAVERRVPGDHEHRGYPGGPVEFFIELTSEGPQVREALASPGEVL